MISCSRMIKVASMLTPNLVLRTTAARLFSYVEGLPNPEIILDFSEVKTITRSFAHEYSSMKNRARKKLIEANVPPEVSKMFEVVRETSAKRSSRARIDFDGVPVVNL